MKKIIIVLVTLCAVALLAVSFSGCNFEDIKNTIKGWGNDFANNILGEEDEEDEIYPDGMGLDDTEILFNG